MCGELGNDVDQHLRIPEQVLAFTFSLFSFSPRANELRGREENCGKGPLEGSRKKDGC